MIWSPEIGNVEVMTDKRTHKQTEYPLVDSTPLVGGVKWKLIFFSGIFSKESQRQSKTGTFCFCVFVSALAILYERENIVRMTEYCTDDRILYGRRIVCVRWAGAGGFYTILLPNILLSTVLLILHFVLSLCHIFHYDTFLQMIFVEGASLGDIKSID